MSNTTLVKAAPTYSIARAPTEFAPADGSLSSTQPLTVLNLLRGLRRCWR